MQRSHLSPDFLCCDHKKKSVRLKGKQKEYYEIYIYTYCVYQPDAMARATTDVVNVYIGGAGLNGYTVISCIKKAMLVKQNVEFLTLELKSTRISICIYNK